MGVDCPRSATLQYHVLVRQLGRRSANVGVYFCYPLLKSFMGKQLYVIVRGPMDPQPRFEGPQVTLGQPARVADALIYRISVDKLPPHTKSLSFGTEGRHWVIRTAM